MLQILFKPQNTDRECYEYPLPLLQYRTEPQNVQNEGGILETFNKKQPASVSTQSAANNPQTKAVYMYPVPNIRG